ncbi:MAG TPA: outer membrane protein assembly factor BamD [Bryobacteraceae bacterium]|nr:outer membrane protein assembly factor BamD [Bryobacteraceae bacterium]
MGLGVLLLSSCGIRRHKYENPIAKDTQQPDKVLFDAAINDLEHGRYERARLELQTMMNTYDTSEYLAKAKLALADSWYREGGAHGMAQAEAEYKDFILFYPQMEEAAEAQEKICKMQYNQMDKSDRDSTHALRAEDECRQLLVQFPNSKFAPEAQQLLRNVQEVLADKEYKVGHFYYHKGSMPSAANRLAAVATQFPLYSQADEALWELGDAYRRMGDRFENQQADAYTRIVRDYPLSSHAQEAKAKLQEMKRPVPEADPVAYARMKYELDNRGKRGLLGKVWEPFSGKADTLAAAKSGAPQMTAFRPTIPASVPATAAGTAGQSGVTDVGAQIATDTSALDKNPDARSAAAQGANADGTATAVPAMQQQFKPNAVTRQGVDLNSATEQEIAKLPGINKTMAKRIVLMRPYLSINDLIRTGLSQKTIAKLKPAAEAPEKSKPASGKVAAKASNPSN